MAPFGRGFCTNLVPVTPRGRPADSEVRAPGLCELTTFSRGPGGGCHHPPFRGRRPGLREPKPLAQGHTASQRPSGDGDAGVGGPLQRLFEDTRYLPIVTLRNKAGKLDAGLHLKQCSTQICANKSSQKSAPGFPHARPASQWTPPVAEGRAGAVPT